MKIPPGLFPEAASIEAYLGVTGGGAQSFGTATPTSCLVAPGNRLVRDSQGNQVVSSTTIYCPTGVSAPAGSRVTVRGDVRVVLEEKPWSGGGLGLPECVQVALR